MRARSQPDSASWWNFISPGTVIRECHLEGATEEQETGELRATSNGLEYVGTMVEVISLPWSTISEIHATVHTRRTPSPSTHYHGASRAGHQERVESTTVTVISSVRSVTFSTEACLAELESRFASVVALTPHRAAASWSSPATGLRWCRSRRC